MMIAITAACLALLSTDAIWSVQTVDRDSGGFGHAALLTDLDEDGRDELYVASDDRGELRRYVWTKGRPVRTVLARRGPSSRVITRNITAAPVSALYPE